MATAPVYDECRGRVRFETELRGKERDMADVEKSENATVVVTVDGVQIPLNRFAADMLSGGVAGMVRSLRGAENPKKIAVQIDLP